MIDPAQLPILIKAIEFIFDEGRKILDERRERRRKLENLQESVEQETHKEVVARKPEQEIQIKQDLLASKVDEVLWWNHEREVEHLVRLLDIYSRNYYLAREQYAKWGDALVPPIIVNNLSESENSMLETIRRLEEVLSKVYQKEIPPIQ